MRGPVLIALVLATTGFTTCSRRPDPPPIPQVVYVPVKEYKALPPTLTADCIEVVKRNNSTGEAVRLANERKAANEECTGRMRDIRALQPKAKP